MPTMKAVMTAPAILVAGESGVDDDAHANDGDDETRSSYWALSRDDKFKNALLLRIELAKCGLHRRRDSRLCDAFVEGTTSETVKEVVLTMCKMKYLHGGGGYCKKFNKMHRHEAELDSMDEYLAEQEGGYYGRIWLDARRKVDDSYDSP